MAGKMVRVKQCQKALDEAGTATQMGTKFAMALNLGAIFWQRSSSVRAAPPSQVARETAGG